MSPAIAMLVGLNLAALNPLYAQCCGPASQPSDGKASAAVAVPTEYDRVTGVGGSEARREQDEPLPTAPQSGGDGQRETFVRQAHADSESCTATEPAATLRLYQQAHRGF